MIRKLHVALFAAVMASVALASLADQPPPESGIETVPGPPALMLIEADITDMDRFREYTLAIVPIVQRFGGRYVVMRGARADLEGDWGQTRIVISEWPSMAVAQAFWDSPEYREAAKLREGTGTFRVTLLETAPPPVTEDKAE
jgi:uncharacterized protein (DUF1330 family)